MVSQVFIKEQKIPAWKFAMKLDAGQNFWKNHHLWPILDFPYESNTKWQSIKKLSSTRTKKLIKAGPNSKPCS